MDNNKFLQLHHQELTSQPLLNLLSLFHDERKMTTMHNATRVYDEKNKYVFDENFL